jgi:hypothetical protein
MANSSPPRREEREAIGESCELIGAGLDGQPCPASDALGDVVHECAEAITVVMGPYAHLNGNLMPIVV